MITNPLIYLFSLAFLATALYTLETKTSWKVVHIFPTILTLYIFTTLLASLDIFSKNANIHHIYTLTLTNLIPAMLFLMLIQIDFTKLLRSNTIGCACTLGVKRYWFLVLLSLGVSFLSQLLAYHFTPNYTPLTTLLIAALLGVIGSFTKLQKVGGSKEIAMTMLYLVIALVGSQTTF